MKPSVRVELVVEEPRWRQGGAGLVADLRRAADAAVLHADRARLARTIVEMGTRPGETPALPAPSPSARLGLTILLADDARLENLNAQFRGKKRPTNVLSFPAARQDGGYLGDIAIAYGVAAREAAETGKTMREHAIHLTVHGVLHLLGYDHETVREARMMEPLEITVLAELGIANPYLVGPALAATAD